MYVAVAERVPIDFVLECVADRERPDRLRDTVAERWSDRVAGDSDGLAVRVSFVEAETDGVFPDTVAENFSEKERRDSVVV